MKPFQTLHGHIPSVQAEASGTASPAHSQMDPKATSPTGYQGSSAAPNAAAPLQPDSLQQHPQTQHPKVEKKEDAEAASLVQDPDIARHPLEDPDGRPSQECAWRSARP
jgi:hypothetical protein